MSTTRVFFAVLCLLGGALALIEHYFLGVTVGDAWTILLAVAAVAIGVALFVGRPG